VLPYEVSSFSSVGPSNVDGALAFPITCDTEYFVVAIEQLADKKDRETVMKLKEALNKDPFHGVRREAAKALRSIHNDNALDALLGCRRRVRI
jgi:HEAT repeats